MYYVDLYLRQDNKKNQEVASFINPLRNYKKFNYDAVKYKSDYYAPLTIDQIYDSINEIIHSNKINKYNFIFVIYKSSIDYSFRDPNEARDKVCKKANIPDGIKLHSLISVRYDHLDHKWYTMPEPNDQGRWAGNLKYNPYKEWNDINREDFAEYCEKK